MRILYAAIDQQVPGTRGGSVHVAAVAEGLAALGHEVHVLATPGDEPFPAGRVHWYPVRPPFGARQFRLLRAREVVRLAHVIRPDVIIERYYNFGGEGLRAAQRVGALAVLEVNAPIIDYPGSPKRSLDRALVVEPMRRWRGWQCRAADLIVTPSRDIVPSSVPRERIVQIEWGADTERFRPDAVGPVPFTRTAEDLVIVFAGAFRAWHGAIHLVTAVRRLHEQGHRHLRAVLIGDGPELPRVRRAAAGVDGIVLTGAVPHEAMPACLAAADIGAAPFDVGAHAPLRLGFYWSPLKVFEYMAAGLPVVAPDLHRLRDIVRHGQEGLLYDPADPEGLARAISRLSDPALRATLGRAARARVEREFGWHVHCRWLAEAIIAALERKRAAGWQAPV